MMKLLKLSTLFLAAASTVSAGNGNGNGNGNGGGSSPGNSPGSSPATEPAPADDTSMEVISGGDAEETCNGPHGCDCFTCGDVVEQEDGSLNISVDHCKGDTISWICCTGVEVDGVNEACDVTSCAGQKCETVSSGDFTVNVPADATSFTINTHDGKTAGAEGALNVKDICGGPPGGQGGACADPANGVTAHCLIEFDIATECRGAPAPPAPAPEVDEPEPEAPAPAPEAPAPEPAACPADEQDCSDGSTVTRVGPDCDFADCPPQVPEPAPEVPAPAPEVEEPEAPAPEPATEPEAPAPEPATEPEAPAPEPASEPESDEDKITICHGTAADNNPYVMITVDASAVAGHFQPNHPTGKKRADAMPGDVVVIGGVEMTVLADCTVEPTSPEPAPEVPAPAPEVEEPEPEAPAPEPATEPEAPAPEPAAEPKSEPSPTPGKASGSGDPHFKTWSGEKFDYHGECDLVLVDNPTFADGKGLRVHIRTTRVGYFSYISKVALQIDNDVLEFDNDVENFLINGVSAEDNRKHHKTMLGGFLVRRDQKALSVRLSKEGGAKIDFHTRKNGFPAIIVDGGSTDIFKGSLGLLGDWATGKRIARDGETELAGEAATLEWQVRDTEEMLFTEARFPQFPTTCTPPAKMPKRLGGSSFEKEAEKACAHWKEDFEDCVFDVIATRDVLVAQEGHIVHVE